MGQALDAAVALFGFAAVEADIRAWFPNGNISCKQIAHASPNLFADGSGVGDAPDRDPGGNR